MPVARLGALSFNTTDVPAWHRLLVDLLGMEARPRASESDPLRVRYDELEYRLEFYPSDENSVHMISWDVDTPEDLAELAERIEKAGYPVERLTHGDNGSRDWAGAIRFTDPEGTPTEIRYGATLDVREFRPSSVIGGFITGDLGMGHFVSTAVTIRAPWTSTPTSSASSSRTTSCGTKPTPRSSMSMAVTTAWH